MLSFSSFLIEAKFSEENFDRLIGVIEHKMPKLLGSPIYRYAGPTGVEKLPGALGYLYFFGKNRAFRVRARVGHVLGIDIWDEYHPDKGPSYTADLALLDAGSIIGAMSKIAAIIKTPKVTEIEVKLTEDLQLDEMAKRVGPESFYDMMVKAYGKDGASSVTWEQIKKVADDNDVLIPAYIRDKKIGRGKWDSTPGTGESKADAPAEKLADTTTVKIEPKTKKEPILYIKVTAQDPDSKKFISAADSATAQKLYAQLNQALSSGEGTEAELKNPDTLYGHLAELVQMVSRGSLRSLLIYGGPGTGKTFTIMKTISDAGLTKGKDYVKISGKASPIEIYKTLFMFRDGGLVVFDDCDSMWRNEDSTNLLKAALDTSPVREISWVSAQTINVSKMPEDKRNALFTQIDAQISGDEAPEEEEEKDEDAEESETKKTKKAAPVRETKVKYPSAFDFKGRVIFISNLKKEEFDTAIMSRSAKINMDLSPSQILERMRSILPTLGGNDVPIAQKEELLAELQKMHDRKEITMLTMREFTKGLDIVRSGSPNWRALLQYS